MAESILIIGAGIAGLAAGCYGQMNGYRTQVLEMHDKPGGLCTSWKRQGYTFDGCIHWLVGSGPHGALNRTWQELGALPGRQIVDHEEFMRVEGRDGRTLVVYTDLGRLERHMKEMAPADAKAIERFCRAAGRCARFGQAMAGAGRLSRLQAMLRMLAFMGTAVRYGKVSMESFAGRFRDPFLRQAFAAIFDLPDFSMIAALMTLAWMHNRDAGYPVGGSLEFSRAIERRYLDLGGTIRYRSRVAKVLVDEVPGPGSPKGKVARAVGVRLADGSEQRADVVISAADGHATIFDLLDGQYLDEKIRGYYADLPIFQPIIQVSLGVACDLSHQPHSIVFALPEPVTIAGQVRERMGARHFGYDPTLAPAGKSVLAVILDSDYRYWKELSQDRERYRAEKDRIAAVVIAQLERRFPDIAGHVEVVDVATPLTYERYTGNWQGSMEGWLPSTRVARLMMRGMRKTLPGLDHFYMAGQWVEPGGGVPTAAMSGRRAIGMICQRDGKRFEARLP